MIMSKKYYDEQVKYMNEIRSIKHDMQAHMIALQYYIESENLDKAKAYLQEMRSYQIFQSSPFKDTGHDMVNAIIYSALQHGDGDIRLLCTGLIPETIIVSDFDLCTIFSNLFSNCVEACQKLKLQDKIISLEMKEEENSFYIIIENPVEWNVDMKILGKSSTKQNKKEHGFGIRNVKKVVKKYNGELIYEASDSLFRVKIMFPDSIQKNS